MVLSAGLRRETKPVTAPDRGAQSEFRIDTRRKTGSFGLASQRRTAKERFRSAAFQITGDADARCDATLRDREMKLSRRVGESERPALRDSALRVVGLGGRAMLAPAAES